MVAMAVAIDEVRDRFVEALGDLGFQPFGGVGVDRIGDNHTFIRDHNSRLVGVVGELPDIAGDDFQAALGVLGGGGHDGKQRQEGYDATLHVDGSSLWVCTAIPDCPSSEVVSVSVPTIPPDARLTCPATILSRSATTHTKPSG